MKIAFLVLNHRHPGQLVRLLSTLRSQLPDSPIAVHHDTFHGQFPREVIEPFADVHLLASGKRVIWGDFSQVDLTCWLLTWLREHLDFDWMVLLSAQDYPVKPLRGLAGDLGRDGADAVFRASPISALTTAAARRDMRRRYLFQYRPAVPARPPGRTAAGRDLLRAGAGRPVDAFNLVQPLLKVYRLPDRMPYRLGWRAPRTPFSPEWPCWHGSSWFALSRAALEYVLDYLGENPGYAEYYRKTMNPDESMLATLVFNSPRLRVANRDTTYTRWSDPSSGHPDVFALEDFPELAAAPQFFARKFDIGRDARILDKLDEFIGASVSS